MPAPFMKIKLELTESDFKDFRSFEKALKKRFGENTYVGTDSLVFSVEYPKELKAMLRPYPETPTYQFELNF